MAPRTGAQEPTRRSKRQQNLPPSPVQEESYVAKGRKGKGKAQQIYASDQDQQDDSWDAYDQQDNNWDQRDDLQANYRQRNGAPEASGSSVRVQGIRRDQHNRPQRAGERSRSPKGSNSDRRSPLPASSENAEPAQPMELDEPGGWVKEIWSSSHAETAIVSLS
ncbi:MAG: hypothetical protein M1819_000815 [Sarea resinae]|nr:MAG: hypothetical protein M1819_000815 [Sarea resinae]